MKKTFFKAVCAGALCAAVAAYLFSDGHEYTMDYYIKLHEWDKKLSPAAKLMTLAPRFSPAQAIRAEEAWRVLGVETKRFRFIERWPQEDDERLSCYRVTLIDRSEKLFFWTPKYVGDAKFGTVIRTRRAGSSASISSMGKSFA